MTYRFLDFPCPELAAGGSSITFYCRCGHKRQLEPKAFDRLPQSSLHKVVAKMKCSICGATGDIVDIILNPVKTGGLGP